MNHNYDLIIIGSGPGGYSTAARAVAKGLNVALIERDSLGGTCLNRGCIPTKALSHCAGVVRTVASAGEYGVDVSGMTLNYAAAAAHRDAVVERLRLGVETVIEGVSLIRGEARFDGSPTRIAVGDDILTAPKVILATGSAPVMLPVPGSELCMDSDTLLALDTLPESMVIIGGGVIGMEFASILNSFGVAVTVLEYCPEILPPFDAEVAKTLRMALKRRGVNIVPSAQVTSVERSDAGLTVSAQVKGKPKQYTCAAALMAVGRTPVLPEELAQLNPEMHGRFIKTDPADMSTSLPGLYAVGDVNGLCMLAHAAEAQGRVALGEQVNLQVIPSAVFTVPECAMVGRTQAQAPEDALVGIAYLRANGKALSMGEPEGIVKIIADRESRRLLGLHICGAHAADLVQEGALLMRLNGTLDDLLTTVHGHPTLGEAVTAAAEHVR